MRGAYLFSCVDLMKKSLIINKKVPTTATLFLTHFINQEVLDRFQRLHESCGETYHVFFALNDEIGYDLACLHGYRTFTFTREEILSQGYTPHGQHVMHNVNYVMQLFRKQHPEYQFY